MTTYYYQLLEPLSSNFFLACSSLDSPQAAIFKAKSEVNKMMNKFFNMVLSPD